VLEHRDMTAMLASRGAEVKKTEADIQEAQVDLKEKEREAARAQNLYARKMVSAEEFQKADAARGMAVAKTASLEASLAWKKANVKEVEENISYMHLYAPFDGTVVDKQGEVGEIINPMSMSTTGGRSAVVTLASLEKMEVETDVAENLLSRVAL